LHAAHELTGAEGEPLNLVHRDISPHNILVGVDGVTRLTDFGVAQAESRLSTTRGGQVKGKFPYMAQEQIQRAPIDRRTDVYAAGAVLWEMLAGERLVRGDNDGQLLAQILKAEWRSVQALNPAVPAEIEAVCQRALQREPDDRHATAAAFGEALEAAAKAAGVAIAAPREVALFVKELKAHESSTDSPSGSVRKPAQAQSASRSAITAPTTETGSVRSEVGPVSTHAAAIAPVEAAPPPKRSSSALLVVAGLAMALGAGAALLIVKPGSPGAAEPAAAATSLAPVAADPPAAASAAPPAPSSVAPTASASSPPTVAATTSTLKPRAISAPPRPTAASPTHFRPTEL
jgi:serine/threonine-protein kinase